MHGHKKRYRERGRLITEVGKQLNKERDKTKRRNLANKVAQLTKAKHKAADKIRELKVKLDKKKGTNRRIFRSRKRDMSKRKTRKKL